MWRTSKLPKGPKCTHGSGPSSTVSYPGPGDITQPVPGLAEVRGAEKWSQDRTSALSLGRQRFYTGAREPSVPGHLHPCLPASETLVMTTRVYREVRGHRLPGPLVRVKKLDISGRAEAPLLTLGAIHTRRPWLPHRHLLPAAHSCSYTQPLVCSSACSLVRHLWVLLARGLGEGILPEALYHLH